MLSFGVNKEHVFYLMEIFPGCREIQRGIKERIINCFSLVNLFTGFGDSYKVVVAFWKFVKIFGTESGDEFDRD